MSVNELITIAAVRDVIQGAIMTLFIISAFLVILIVLAQEGKGGGLAGAFGGAGSETFGVKAGTVNSATAWVGAMFLGLALLYAGLSTAQSTPTKGVDSMENLPGDSAPVEPPGGSAPVAPPGGSAPVAPPGGSAPVAPPGGDDPGDDAPGDDSPGGDAPGDDAPKDDDGEDSDGDK
ncbi:MAG: preprotein translocase subunit SecG [Planctomycetota bacterium]|nr:preprotein translocase subunit SecG [Planctomycetota bacterium]